MRSSCHDFSSILNNQNKISQACSRVNVVIFNTFCFLFGSGVSELGDLKVDNFAMLFLAGF